MGGLNVLWYVGAGFLLGWVISTLTEWLWFRGRRVGTASTGHREDTPARGQQPVGYPAADYQPYVADPSSAAQPSSASGDRPDPLSDIRGIGDVYEQRLYEAGIFTWHELSLVDVDTLRAVTKALPNSKPDGWIEQARRLAAENGRIGAMYTGPVPDNLTRIQGIDQVFEQELVQAGIITFSHLGETTAPELAAIIPAHRLDDAIDFAAWIAEARELQAKD
jgi:predicted flap endonuclease-1-like 5' DNA nuclease